MHLRTLEKKIQTAEGFDVRFHYNNGRNARSDRGGLPSYPYHRAAKGFWSVAKYRSKRLAVAYPGFRFTVLDGTGRAAHGRTGLAILRQSYQQAPLRSRPR